MKPTHDIRENWRTDSPNLKTWQAKLNSIEQAALGLAFIAVIFGTAGYLSLHWGELSLRQLLEDFYTNASVELLSIAVIVLLIGRLMRLFESEAKKKDLILQMGSSDNGFARESVRQLRHYEWLVDGSMVEADLSTANLQGAMLQFANLQRVDLNMSNLGRAMLVGADLTMAQLRGINLQEADLVAATFIGADLHGANLQRAAMMRTDLQNANLKEANMHGVALLEATLEGANLVDANLGRAMMVEANLRGAQLQRSVLRESDLRHADLCGADLTDANMRNALNFDTVKFDAQTTLPNGDQWRDGYDVGMFTDPDHPDFWQPDWVIERREKVYEDTLEK